MTLTLYGLKACDTCRKAMKALQAKGNEVQFVDVRADGVPSDKLAGFFDEFGDALLNNRSTTWRGLSEEQRTKDPLELLAEFPTLMKRPVIQSEKGLTLGWKKDAQNQHLEP